MQVENLDNQNKSTQNYHTYFHLTYNMVENKGEAHELTDLENSLDRGEKV